MKAVTQVTKHPNPKLDISDSEGIAEPMAETQGHKNKSTYGHFDRKGGFKVQLICYLFATYFVYLLHIWLKNVNK